MLYNSSILVAWPTEIKIIFFLQQFASGCLKCFNAYNFERAYYTCFICFEVQILPYTIKIIFKGSNFYDHFHLSSFVIQNGSSYTYVIHMLLHTYVLHKTMYICTSQHHLTVFNTNTVTEM